MSMGKRKRDRQPAMWKNHPEARAAVHRNRRRIRGARGLRLLRLRDMSAWNDPSRISTRPAGCACLSLARGPVNETVLVSVRGGRSSRGQVQLREDIAHVRKLLMYEDEVETLCVERDCACDVFHVIANAMKALDQKVPPFKPGE